ncbi:MAG: hypothetical protein ACM3PS_03525, partial [Syntrophothermus sp.]
MQLTLLLDLDDTLLDTHVDVFAPAYIQALVRHMAGRVSPDILLPALARGTGLMNQTDDPTHTLKEVFDASFFPELGVPRDGLDEVINDFYENVFPDLAPHTQQRAEAGPFVE